MTCKEKELWAEVITLAVDDAFAAAPGWRQGINDWMQNRRDARLFLTKKTGPWSQSRDTICSVVDLDPDGLRDRIVARIRKEEAKEAADEHEDP